MSDNLLEIKELSTGFFTEDGFLPALDKVSLTLKKGETLGVVGESGSGKSLTSLSVMNLIPTPGKAVGGEILFKGRNVLQLGEEQMRAIRGNEISMIFQEPMTSLNPVYSVGEQIMEVLRLHQKLDKKAARAKTIDMLRLVGIPSPENRVDDYPHQLSGGMRQRVMIAMALSCQPDLLIADEPTTALDVTTQAQILDLMLDLKERLHTSILLITHDLGVIAEAADHVAVMYAGKVVEYAEVKRFFREPLHPYSQGLMNSIPTLEQTRERLQVIKGVVPTLQQMPKGCRFCTRCDEKQPLCEEEAPPLIGYQGSQVSCWKYTERWEPSPR